MAAHPVPADRTPIDFAALMRPVAERLLGEPNAAMSRGSRMRWGSKGSIEVDVEEGWFCDYEAGDERGGVIRLIEHKLGCDTASALTWLEDQGLKETGSVAKVPAASTFYDYQDPDGQVVFRVERRKPRTFLQHAPDGKGGFYTATGCMQGVELVPYRLPQMLFSDPKAIVFFCEGEKDVDRLTDLGLVATTNPGGAGKVRDHFAEHFRGRRVVALEDNDDAGAKHVARVREVIAPVASCFATLRLPGAKKSDVSDWLAGGGSAFDLVARAEAALSAPDRGNEDAGRWTRPVDLWARYEPAPLPTGLIPGIVEAFARRHGETMGVDPAGLAMAALTVCAAAIPDKIKVRVKRHDPTWKESARLWVALIGPPSSKKTPIMGAAVRPLGKIDSRLFREYVSRLQEYQALDASERKQTNPPPQRRLRISDATIEAAQEVLKDSPDGVLSQQDELSGWFGAMDKYSAGKGAMADRGFWLQAFNGGSYALNRVARGASLIPNLSINVLGGIQPEPLRRIVGDAVDDGLIQRLIPVILAPAKVGLDEPQDGCVERYEMLVEKLWQLEAPRSGSGEPGYLMFDEEGQKLRSDLEAKHLEMVGAEVISPKLASHFGKYDGLFARLCVLWHCIENVDRPELPVVIPHTTARHAADFLHRFIAPSAIAFYTGTLGLSDDHEALIELASFIISHRLATVQHRDCQRGSTTLKALEREQSRRLFEKLESLSWLEPTEPPRNSNTPRWAVNPAVFDLFEDRAKAERERRQKARENLVGLLTG